MTAPSNPLPTMIQWGVYLFVNSMFIYKYSMRVDIVSPYVLIAAYALLVAALHRLAARYATESRCALVALLAAATVLIALLLWKVEPLGVNVDRWSATSYFLDALFRGEYPYAVTTHIGNYCSPFPLWQYLNIPFWLMGDVGLGLIAFLWLLAWGVVRFTQSFRTTFVYMLLLLASPAYWWEVVVRSDGLSNAILVFCALLLMISRDITFARRPVTAAVICGLVACTRLSAALPVGIMLLRPWLVSGRRAQTLSLAIILAVVMAFFAPYVLWGGDMSTFTGRNPFQTQTFQMSLPAVLLLAAVVAWLSWRERPVVWMIGATGAVMLAFILATMLWHNMMKPGVSVWTDGDFDVSYLTLSLPYALLYLTYNPRKLPTTE